MRPRKRTGKSITTGERGVFDFGEEPNWTRYGVCSLRKKESFSTLSATEEERA
jgi:hypothetical protein